MSKRVTFDYSKLRGRIYEISGTVKKCAERTGIRAEMFTEAFNGRRTFTQSEIVSICDELKISADEIPIYFFTH